MSLKIYDTLTPQGDYPAVSAADVLMPDGTRLDTWKPQGGATTEAALFLEQEMTAFNQIPTGAYAVAEGGILFSLVAGEAYRVVYRGESYTVTAAEPKSGLISLGNAALMGDYEDTGEAFLIYTDVSTSFTVFIANADGPHTFGVYQTVVTPDTAPPVVQGVAGQTISPERYYVFGSVTGLDVVLEQMDDGRAHEYTFEFEPSDGFTGLTITPEVRWLTETEYPAGKKCLVSIIMGMAAMGYG